MGGPRDADADVGDYFDGLLGQEEAYAAGLAEVAAVVASIDPERRGEFAGAGAKCANGLDDGAGIGETPAGHQVEAAGGFEGADEDEAVFGAPFYENVQHPVDAVVKVDVGSAGLVFEDEGPGGRAREGVGGFVVQAGVGFSLDDDAGAMFPDEGAADELAGACERIALEEGAFDSRGGREEWRHRRTVSHEDTKTRRGKALCAH
jgi:hypothetical protein